MNWKTPMLFFSISQSYLPADTQNRTDTMMKPSCCRTTGDDGSARSADELCINVTISTIIMKGYR